MTVTYTSSRCEKRINGVLKGAWREWYDLDRGYTITNGLCDDGQEYDVLFRGRWVEGSTCTSLAEAKELVEAHREMGTE